MLPGDYTIVLYQCIELQADHLIYVKWMRAMSNRTGTHVEHGRNFNARTIRMHLQYEIAFFLHSIYGLTFSPLLRHIGSVTSSAFFSSYGFLQYPQRYNCKRSLCCVVGVKTSITSLRSCKKKGRTKQKKYIIATWLALVIFFVFRKVQ